MQVLHEFVLFPGGLGCRGLIRYRNFRIAYAERWVEKESIGSLGAVFSVPMVLVEDATLKGEGDPSSYMYCPPLPNQETVPCTHTHKH